MAQNGSQITGFAGFGLTAHQLGHRCDTFLSFKVFGPKPGYLVATQHGMAALFCFFFAKEWFGTDLCLFFNEVRTEIKKKNTCLQKIHPFASPCWLTESIRESKNENFWTPRNQPSFLTTLQGTITYPTWRKAKYSKIIFKSTGC